MIVKAIAPAKILDFRGLRTWITVRDGRGARLFARNRRQLGAIVASDPEYKH